MKTIIVGIVTRELPLGPGHEGMDVETCYRDGSPIYVTKLKDELLEHDGKRVMITIEDL